ncbi:hypothetical protein ABK040_000067 [Willaertia magna]
MIASKPNPARLEKFLKRNTSEATLSAIPITTSSQQGNPEIKFFENGQRLLPPLLSNQLSSFPTEIKVPNVLPGEFKQFQIDDLSPKKTANVLSWEHNNNEINNSKKEENKCSQLDILKSKYGTSKAKEIIEKEKDISASISTTTKTFNLKDSKFFLPDNGHSKLRTLCSESYRNGIVRNSELKELNGVKLTRTLGFDPTKERNATPLLRPKKQFVLREYEKEYQQYNKTKKEIKRSKNKLIRILRNGYRGGILGNVEDTFGVYEEIKQQMIEREHKLSEKAQKRREFLNKITESTTGKITLDPLKINEINQEDINPYDGGCKIFQTKTKTELSESMRGYPKLLEIKNGKPGQNAQRLEKIFHHQTQDRGYNIINGSIYEVDNVKIH